LADLADLPAALAALARHLDRHGQRLSGIACYDCESLLLAAAAAEAHGLSFHPAPAIRAARDKGESKRLWRAASVPCPASAAASTLEEARRALEIVGLPAIVKPLTGAGSELVFRSETKEEALKAFKSACAALIAHGDPRMYAEGGATLLFESFVSGPEFSADFLLEAGRARALRLGGKLVSREAECGIARAYVVPAFESMGVPASEVEEILARAATSLGFTGGLFMADFIVSGGTPKVLEVTPRVSGDCLPWLSRRASGLDTLGLTLDCAEGLPLAIPEPGAWRPLVGLRLFARRAGTVKVLDGARLLSDPRVEEVHFYRRPGHRVALPPDDYHSRVLGHALFRPDPARTLEEECAELEALLDIRWEEDA